ncbi:MAG: molybdenum cofactor guanylyltransferase MobA [Methylobacterium sp.]|uniref:molybdenum cofactor guanylyltransferase MobA n=1 Tax=Methylobacterium sp. TaxID=409 RepID=UPI0025E146AB|nr:molybdenum cofactor guanylyltransferase MobA [Methylobacterium sp.]MBX9930419.1 molybdenum cofactor guanylyltransferase MobA [Methylobacterium sp.]
MAEVLGVILAGGLSRRMGGGDKPLMQLADRTLLDWVRERFAPQCGAGVILNANGDPGRFTGFPGAIVPDGVPGHPGPLAGILAALDHAAAHHPDVTHVASVTGDAPFLPLDLVARLKAGLGQAPIAMAASGGRQHFTTALWSVCLTDDLRTALVEREERRVGSYLARHGATAVEWSAKPVDPFLNVNTPEDLVLAEELMPLSTASG